MSEHPNRPWPRVISKILSFLLLQLGWVACVGGAARGWFWIGPLMVAGLLAAYFAFPTFFGANPDQRRRDLELVLALGLVGTAVDSIQSCLGLLRFEGAWHPCLCPLWITALWLHFGTAVGTSFAGLAGRHWLATLVGAVGGPVAYGAGARLGAAQLHPQWPWLSLMVIAGVWGVLLPGALRFAGRAPHPSNR
jgi:hypothetical protein